ncbi:hypothetical protein [Aquimarina algiphila]|uniref:Uncharacterized protein n=1 Tax=Aquimarina algiphila TaxID=2047982 RepID=A0A554VRJ5_9FLAO|nr:hypothetical protein [Aquimarina algiphila]TSE11277.1 hypothetical protein FOF46_01215 [Aquimarina algiphila]
MALLPNPGVVTSPSGVLRTSFNYISQYDYATQYEPNKVLGLHPRYGNGLITGFCKIVGAEKAYNSDVVLHGEQSRLMNFLTDVTVAGSTFTTSGGAASNIRVNDAILISDGTTEAQGVVTAVNSTSEFVVANREAGAFSFTGNVNISIFSSEWGKGTAGFTQGYTYDPDIYTNYTHIIKEFYDVAESDMAHATWLSTPEGQDMWYSYELERNRIKFQNKQELTHIFSKRAESGSAADTAGLGGMNGIVPIVEERGNVGNDYIRTLDEIDAYTKRIRRQGDATSYTGWCDQDQRILMSNILGAVNRYADTGANYGVFNNSKDLAIHLDFESFSRNGISFHLTDWKLLNDPTVMGGANFLQTNVAALFVPAGEREVTNETGSKEAAPYICIRYRQQGDVNRQIRTKIFGLPGTEIREDKMEVQYISEQTNQVVGANEFIVVKR